MANEPARDPMCLCGIEPSCPKHGLELTPGIGPAISLEELWSMYQAKCQEVINLTEDNAVNWQKIKPLLEQLDADFTLPGSHGTLDVCRRVWNNLRDLLLTLKAT